jgi:hypothetical protein
VYSSASRARPAGNGGSNFRPITSSLPGTRAAGRSFSGVPSTTAFAPRSVMFRALSQTMAVVRSMRTSMSIVPSNVALSGSTTRRGA